MLSITQVENNKFRVSASAPSAVTPNVQDLGILHRTVIAIGEGEEANSREQTFLHVNQKCLLSQTVEFVCRVSLLADGNASAKHATALESEKISELIAHALPIEASKDARVQLLCETAAPKVSSERDFVSCAKPACTPRSSA